MVVVYHQDMNIIHSFIGHNLYSISKTPYVLNIVQKPWKIQSNVKLIPEQLVVLIQHQEFHG